MRPFVFDAYAADAPTGAAADMPPAVNADKMLMDNLLILGLLFFIFYFILIRPQQKKIKAHNEMLKSLAKGSKVVTSGGLYGTIVKFEGDDVAVLEVAPNVKIRVARAAISDTTDKGAAVETANDN